MLEAIHEDDIVVYELSSFQLWDMDMSPHVAVVLMIAEEHMDVHKDLDEYVAAKANIAAHQLEGDVVIHHPTNHYAVAIAEQSPGLSLAYMTPDGAMVVGEAIVLEGMAVIDVQDVGLLGPHNLENICAAMTAAWQFITDVEAIKQVVSSFTGLPHRLEFIAEKHQVNYYDDSISTTPESAIAALNSFAAPKVMILGGSSKSSNFKELAKHINSASVRAVVALGDEAPTIKRELLTAGFKAEKILDGLQSMRETVQLAAELAEAGDVVVLSPACASFDMFKNYADRGDQFKAAVSEL
jgi:UDP-N-acetylmuramoylalanine--D-glutamate ligase